LAQIFQNLLNKINPHNPAIAVIHQSVAGASYGSNQETFLGNDPLIPINTLTDPKLSYVALGHLHKHQVLSENPPVIYSGSPERIDFGEEIEDKGFVVAEINKNQKTKWKFVTLPVRRFKTINISLPENQEPIEYLSRKIKEAEIKDAVIKINILGQESQLSKITEPDLRELTKQAFFVASISKKSETKTTHIEIAEEILNPMDWFSKYLEIKNFSPQEKKSLKEAAQKLIEELS